MQQYFIDKEISINDSIPLGDDILFHIKKVLRKSDGYIFRLCDSTHTIYEVELSKDNAVVLRNTFENNELDVDITVVLSLIKPDKWDFAIQKLCELGVKRIVPYMAKNCVIKHGDNKRLDRYRKIVQEASEQSHRNIVPEICDYASFKDIDKYLSKNNYLAYEKETSLDYASFDDSVTIVIGPEGGFDIDEVNNFISKGFKSISLGKRILRAETAAIYATSLVVIKQ